MFKFEFNTKRSDNSIIENIIDMNPLRFKVSRNMIEDCYDIDILEYNNLDSLRTKFSEDNDEPLILPMYSNDEPIHPNTYQFIDELCNYLFDNNITFNNYTDYFEKTREFISDLLDKLCIVDNTFHQEFTKKELLINALNSVNFLNCDNNSYDENIDCSYVIEVMCNFCAQDHILQILSSVNTETN
jgi:hypothetical protein